MKQTRLKNMLKFSAAILAFFTPHQATASINGCPFSHPFAYKDGYYCCRHSVEAYRPSVGDNPPCDGGPLELNSQCCRDDDYTLCPFYGNACRSVMRETCYLDGEITDHYNNGGQGESLSLCMAMTEEDPGAEAIWIKQMLDFKTEEWSFVQECSRTGGGTRDCRFKSNREVFIGAPTDTRGATSGLTRALSQPPPARRCDPPRRFRVIRGRLRCRRPAN